jgi:hypothetical protein
MGQISLAGQALALHNLSTNGLITRTGAGTVAGRTISNGTGVAVTDGDGVANNPSIALTGQALALHNINTNGFIYRTGNSTFTAATTGATTLGNVPFYNSVPATAQSDGAPGAIAIAANGTYMYVCTATNLWARIPLQAF